MSWPNPLRPGVPLRPERDALHVLWDNTLPDSPPTILLWVAEQGTWSARAETREPVAECYTYSGPFVTPEMQSVLVQSLAASIPLLNAYAAAMDHQTGGVAAKRARRIRTVSASCAFALEPFILNPAPETKQ